MPRTKFDEATAAEFRRLHERGFTREQIERRLGIAPSTATKWARELGVEFHGAHKVDAATLARMRSLFEQGFSNAEMALELGLGKSTVVKHLREMGLKRAGSESGRMGRMRSPVGAGVVGGSVVGRIEAAKPARPRDGLFQPEYVSGDGPLARRYRAERGLA